MLYIRNIGLDDDVTWEELCTSCDVESSPEEKKVGKKTLEDCKQSCIQAKGCTGIDYGKDSRSEECYHNYGWKNSHIPHKNFDAYILKGYFLYNYIPK